MVEQYHKSHHSFFNSPYTMEKSKLARLLQTFSKEELRELSKFAATPYFNSRPEAESLLRFLSKPLLAGKPLPGKEEAYHHIFKKGLFDDHRIRMAMSALFQTAEKFLVVHDFLKDRPAYQVRLSRVLRSKGLSSPADLSLQSAAVALQQLPTRNANYYLDFYQLEEEHFRMRLETPEAGAADLQTLSDQLDTAILARKLWQGCFLLAHQARYNKPCDLTFLNQILPYAAKRLDIPAISIYFHCYQALTKPGENQHFHAFKQDLLAHDSYFPPDELRDLYILAINFCTRKYNEGDHGFLHDQFELYKIGFDKNYFHSEGVLSRFTYLNAATIGLVVGEYSWVEQFILSKKALLDPDFRESLFSFNMARLAYHKGNFRAALQLLQRAEYKETMLALAAKTIQMKIYYETDEFDLLESHLQAIAAFIRRKKVMGYHRENYLNLVQFVRRLLEIAPLDKKGKQDFKNEVAQTRPLAEKDWLLKQL